MNFLKINAKYAARFLLSLLGKDAYFSTELRNINKIRYGSDYGGYMVCPDRLGSESIIYSFGLGDDISFDLDIIKMHGCNVYAYDPSPETKLFLSSHQLPHNFLFHELALGANESVMRFYPSPNKRINYSLVPKLNSGGDPIEVPVTRLATILAANKHTKIDLLKMDIEGAEFDVLQEIFSQTGIEIEQLVIEFHHKHKEFSGNGLSLLKQTVSLLKSRG